MESFLIPDIIPIILEFLDKDSSFHFLHTTKCMLPFKTQLYNKYIFVHKKIKKKNINKHIVNIRKTNPKNLKIYPNLKHLTICDPSFCGQLINLPKTLQSLTLEDCDDFDEPIDDLPQNLKLLKLLSCTSFDNPINKLPHQLHYLHIDSYAFHQSLNFLPGNLQKLKLHIGSLY